MTYFRNGEVGRDERGQVSLIGHFKGTMRPAPLLPSFPFPSLSLSAPVNV